MSTALDVAHAGAAPAQPSVPPASPSMAVPTGDSSAPVRPRFWSEADCQDILRRLERVTTGGGHTALCVWSTWTGHVRWARNLVSTAGETRDNFVLVFRELNGAQSGAIAVNDVSDAGLARAARHAEHVALLQAETMPTAGLLREPYPRDEAPASTIFSEATYQLGAGPRAEVARRLAKLAADQGLRSAGYVQVAAHALAFLDTEGHVRYAPFTQAQYSVTVRDPKGTGSGWAGSDHWDWAKLDPEHLTQVALEKCVHSKNPVRLEPGRYTAILEPQAVSDLVGQLAYCMDTVAGGPPTMLGREANESLQGAGPFTKRLGFARLGERVIDPRLTIATDPADPELGYPTFSLRSAPSLDADVSVYHPATWIKDGVLQTLGYSRGWAVEWLATARGLPNPGGFRMSVTGPTATVEEMIQTTKRGLLVTRFDQVQLLNGQSTLCRGYTRDGLWLIEDGKISKPVKNFQFTETILGKLNSVEQIGVPTRAFHPLQPGIDNFTQPVVVPALKLTDFSFTALADAV